MLLAVSLCIPTQAAYANPLEDAGNAIASFFGLNDAEAQAALDESAVADGATYDQWENYLTDENKNFTTENIGRIWTDKTVSTEDIKLSASSAGNAPTMEKGNSDFLVMLSALSSTSNLTTTSNKPLDIVLVLDVSGSMAQGLETYTYTETYNVNTDGRTTYYAKVDDSYVEIDRVTTGWRPARFDHWELNDIEVEPKTSANDNTEGHIQFYTRSSQSSGSKMNALKTAVNGFIDATAEQNDTINDADKQHRISIVKYADDTYNYEYGNDTMPNNRNYNYTQRLNPLTAYNSSNASDLKEGTADMDGVDDLVAAGATSADYGMTLAQRELTENGRDDAVKVVVFFTDGEPNHSSGFSGEVANATITVAQTLKNDPPQNTGDPAGFGALVYSVGVFGDANPNDTTGNFNAFMHGVSSNYPDATTYTNLGERAENSNYYKAAGSSDELNNIFEEIADDVQKAAMGSPTEVGSGDPTESGYITFTDTVGDYMKVDSFKSIVYADKQFYPVGEPEESSDRKTLTYKFTGTAGGNGHYAEGDMSDIIITVTRSGDGDAAAVQQGDTVTVKIPATLIPLRNFKVDTDAAGNTTLEVTENYPIRIAYGVSLKSGVDDLLKNPDETMQAYINANKSGDNNVAFYSNAFTPNAADGLTSSSFDPSTTNSFYNFTTATPLYTDEACTIPATEIDAANNTYYYKRSHYVRNADGSASVKEEHIALVPGTSVLTINSGKYVAKDPNGNCYITAGAPRLQRVNDFTKGEKVDPQTGTATNVINPVWNTGGTANYTQINVWLGNNGKLTKEMPGALSVTKNVEVPEGFTNNFANTEFGFSIALMDAAGNALPADTTFDAVVTNEQGEVQGDASKIKLDGDGKYTHKLKDGQTLTVRGLTAGTTYTVTEVNAPAYFDQAKTGDTGAIAANTTSAAVFTNTYNPTDAVMPADSIKAQKDLDGRAWHEGDTFAFTLTPEEGAPLPEGTPEGQTYKNVEVTNEDVVSFGSITFDAPGTYVYEIGEVIPEEGNRLPGISYPQTKYHATVQVSDDGKGVLSIASVTMTKDVSENGTPINPGTEVPEGVAVFTNTYDDEVIEANITGTKNYTDNSGKNPLTADKFRFTATPTGDNAASAPVPTGVGAGASFSFGHTATGVINFPTLKFTSGMDGQSFSYTVTENIPTGAVDNVYQGMTYDPTVWTVTATVSVDPTVDPDDPDAEAVSVAWSAVSSAEGGTKTHVTFANSYTPTPAVLTGDASIRGSKTLDGRNAGADEDFTFTITGADSATTAAMTNGTITFENGTTATVSNAENGVEQFFGFGDATFTRPGTYTFNINETIPDTNPGGMTYDTHTGTVTVDVVDNNGVLTATVGDYNNGSGKTTDYAAFVNTYRASLNYSTSVDLYVSKTLNGRDMAADEFDFTITGSKDFSETASNKAAGNGVADGIKMLNGITFTQDDAGQTYRYIVDEVDPETTLPSVTYDKTQYAIDVVVADNGNGTLSTSTTVTRIMNAEGESVNEPVGTYGAGQKIPDGTVAFVNTYNASPVPVDVTAAVPLTKEVVGRDWLSGETFSFTAAKHSFNGSLAAAELAKMPPPASSPITVNKPADNGNSAVFGLGNLTFSEAGTYVYRVSEVKPDQPAAGMDYSANTAYITIKIKDNTTTGGLEVESAAVTAGSSTFTNSFSSTFNFSDAVTFQLSKTLTGHAMTSGQFHFTVTAADTASAEKIQLPAGQLSADVPGAAGADGEKVIMPNGGDIVFNHSATATDSGKTFSYTFSEVIPDGATPDNDYTFEGYKYDPTVYTMEIKPDMDVATGTWIITTNFTTNKKDGHESTTQTFVWKSDNQTQEVAAADFVNRYAASGTLDGSTALKVSKSLIGRDWAKGDSFTFKIEAGTYTELGAGEATEGFVLPMPKVDGVEKTTVKVEEKDVAASFGNITFTQPGIYTYKVSEVVPTGDDSEPGMSYSPVTYTVTVKATDEAGNGTLKLETSYSPELVDGAMNFINSYQEKTVDGTSGANGAAQVGDELTYTIKYANTEASAANVVVTDVVPTGTTFVSASDGGSYDSATNTVTWTFNNVASGASGEAIMTVKVSEDAVVENIENSAFIKIGDHEPSQTTKVITPLGKPGSLTISKNVVNGDANKSFEFTLELKDSAGNALTGTYETEYKDGAGAPVTSGDKINLKHDEYVIIKGLPAGATYKVTETKASGYTTTIKDSAAPADDGQGEILAGAEATVEFTNTYATTPGGAQADTDTLFTKSISGRDWKEGDEFTFTLTPQANAPLRDDQGEVQMSRTHTVSYENPRVDGKVTFGFGKLYYTFDDIKGETPDADGKRTKTFAYNVTENDTNIAGIAKDPDTATITVTLTDDGAGNLTAAAVVTASNVDFVNTYSSSLDYVGAGGLAITKTLNGRDMEANQFAFTVTPQGGTNTTADDAKAKLGIDSTKDFYKVTAATNGSPSSINLLAGKTVTFTQDDAGKTYVYEIEETKIGGAGYKNDTAKRTVTIAVSDNGNATLTVTTTVTGGPDGDKVFIYTTNETPADAAVVPFTNLYYAETGDDEATGAAVIKTTKTLNGRDLTADEFNFEIRPQAGGDVVATATNDANGNVVFAPMTYNTDTLGTPNGSTEDGKPYWELKYIASEVTTGLPGGVSATTRSFDFTVTVVDNGDGTLTATPALPAGNGFENTYSTGEPIPMNLKGTKVLKADGLTPDSIEGKFTFTVESMTEGAPMPEKTTVTNDADNNVDFGKIEFSLDDLNKALKASSGDTTAVDGEESAETRAGVARSFDFVYKITESGSADGVTNDTEATKTVTFRVADDGAGKLTAKRLGEDTTAFVFTNTYSVDSIDSSVTDQITITKKLDGREIVGGEFNFELVEDGKVVAKGSNDVDGKVTFEAITYNTPGEHDYSVREVNDGKGGVTYDTKNYSIHTSVTDNGDGTLSVKHELKDAQEALFTNTYEADPATVNLGAAKLVNNAKPGDARFTFQVLDKDGKVVAEAQNDEEGAVKFPTLTFDAAGEYDYTIVEVNDGQEGVTYDESKIALKVVVSATDESGNYTGQLYPSVEYVDGTPMFTNAYTEPENPSEPGGGKPGGSEPPALPDTSDNLGPLAIGLGVLAVIACAGLVVAATKMRRKPGSHRAK